MSEKQESKRIGASPVKNSGRGIRKGDAIWRNQYVLDYKEHINSMSISQQVWSKLCSDTLKNGAGLWPVLVLVLGKQQRTRLAVIEWSLFEELVTVYEHAQRSQ